VLSSQQSGLVWRWFGGVVGEADVVDYRHSLLRTCLGQRRVLAKAGSVGCWRSLLQSGSVRVEAGLAEVFVVAGSVER
jgi:hypothetical protein